LTIAPITPRPSAATAITAIHVELRPTAGSAANRRLLSDEKERVDFGFVRGGSTDALREAEEKGGVPLVAVGSLFLEPVWVFVRAQQPIKRFLNLKGKRLAVGASGSGTYLLANQLLSAAGITESNTTLVRGDSSQAVASLSQGTIDAAFFVASPAAPLIRSLLEDPNLQLLDFDRAAAYGRLFPFLAPVILAEGVVNLERNVPSHDTSLVAVSANLAARGDLHASLIPALLEAITKVHEGGGLLEQKRQFPSVDFVDLPLNEDARRYIANGPSFLYRWLPYGWAVLLDRLKILILPFLALLIPLFRVAPPLYDWRTRSKIYRWYAVVREIDTAVQEKASAGEAQSLVDRLANLEREVTSVSVPLSYTGELYNLRLHIHLLQQKLERLSQSPQA